MDYRIVVVSENWHTDAARELEKEVKRLIKSGWKLQGGVSVSRSDHGSLTKVVMSQAMIKE